MRAFAFIFGIVFLTMGVLGLAIPDNPWISLFHFNFAFNALHIVSGIIALVVGFLNRFALRLFFQMSGVLYSILAVLGFVYGDKGISGLFSSSIQGIWFHVIVATSALILGYSK